MRLDQRSYWDSWKLIGRRWRKGVSTRNLIRWIKLNLMNNLDINCWQIFIELIIHQQLTLCEGYHSLLETVAQPEWGRRGHGPLRNKLDNLFRWCFIINFSCLEINGRNSWLNFISKVATCCEQHDSRCTLNEIQGLSFLARSSNWDETCLRGSRP